MIRTLHFTIALLALCAVGALAAGPTAITYAGWSGDASGRSAQGSGARGLDPLEQRMVDTWNADHPETPVAILPALDPAGWEQGLASASAAGTLPDVFVVRSFSTAMVQGWLADITDLVVADPAWRSLPKPVANAAFRDYRAWAVPFTQQLMGYFVNRTLLEKEKYPVPGPGWTVGQFEELVKSLARPKTQVLGLTEEVQIPEWYPAALNSRLRWYSWDGRSYNLDGPEFKAGVEMARKLFTSGWVFDGLRDDQRKRFASAWSGEAWEKGLVALRWDGTWSQPRFAGLGFAWDFIGVPGGRTVIVNDWLGISRSSSRLADAYSFARWMSFSRPGWLTRLRIADKEGLGTWSLPPTTDAEVLAVYFSARGTPGIRALYATLDEGIVETLNVVPGYQASRWDGRVSPERKAGEVLWNCIRGSLKIDEWATRLNDTANQELRRSATPSLN